MVYVKYVYGFHFDELNIICCGDHT